MNILVLSHLYPRPDDSSYGIFVHRQVKQLQRLGHYVVVLSPTPWSPRILHFNAKWRDYGLTPDKVTWKGIEVYYTRYLRLPGAWFRGLAGHTIYKSLLSLALKLHHDHEFDIIHSNMLLPDGLAGLYLGRKLNLPTVCTVHGDDGFINPYENPLNLYYSKTIVHQTTQIVAVSQALQRAVECFQEPSKAIRVVYNGVNIEEFQKSRTPEPETKLKRISGKPYILFVGRQVHIKGLKDLLVAFAQLANKIDHDLVVVGPTLDEVKKLDPELTELLIDRLIVTGPLSPDEIPIYMQYCELFVLPSHSEGLGIVILEAMASERPVIATRVGGIPEMVTDGVTGLLVPPHKPLLLAEALQSLLDDPARCREMGRQGWERVVKKFTWELNAIKMESIYQNAINTGAATCKLPN